MKVFDFNVHLPIVSADINETVASERNAVPKDLLSRYANFIPEINFLSGVNVMVFNENFLEHNLDSFLTDANQIQGNTNFTLLLNFRSDNAFEIVDTAISKGIKSFKYHSYHQEIGDNDIKSCVDLAKYIESKNGMLCIDASFGTLNMFNHDNLKLACEVGLACKKMPIIILHSGGIQCLKALLIALDSENIYLETSFTLPTFKGSSVETDLAFTYKTMDKSRIIYASDAPYVNANESLKIAQEFFDGLGYSSSELEDVFFNNANNLF